MTRTIRHSLRLLVIMAWGALTAVSVAAQSPAEADSLSQRLEAAEQRIRSLEQLGNSASNRYESSFDADATIFDDKLRARIEELIETPREEPKMLTRPTVQAFGRVHLETLGFENDSPGIGYFENPSTGTPPEDRIQFRRIRIGVEGDILDDGIYCIELDFSDPSRSTFRDVYVGFEHLPILQTLFIGNVKRAVGLDGWNSSQHVLFLERPLAINAFNPNFRRIGVQSHGHTADDSVNWQFGISELTDLKNVGRYIGDNIQMSYNARVSTTPWYDEVSGGRGYLHLGVSNMYATTDADASSQTSDMNQSRFGVKPELQTSSQWIDTGMIRGGSSFNVTGLESVLNVGSLQIAGEYLTTTVNRRAASDLNFQGGYIQAGYFLTGEHQAWDRQAGRLARPKLLENFFLVKSDKGIGHGWGAWQIAARWSTLSLSDKDIQGGRQENTTLGLNWYWTPYSRVIFNTVHGRIRDRDPVGGFTGGRFTGYGVRMMVDF